MAVYTRPYLYPKQEAAIFNNKRWLLCEASTKSGKTVASIVRIIEWAFNGTPGSNFWWVAPVSDQARIAFSRVKQNLTAGSFTARESPVPTINLITGTSISFRSADNPDSLFGEDVYGAIMDEASRCRPEAWYAVRSTLTATRGPCVLIGNVKGRRNWFYEWCRRAEAGLDPNAQFSRITWRDAVEAKVLDLEEIEDARRNLPEHVFRELYEAEASDDGANPFGEKHIIECVRGLSNNPPIAFGIDLAKKQDYLVVIGLDEFGNVASFDRWQRVPWRESIQRIHTIVGEDIPALVDSTGIGDPVLEELQVEHGNFHGFMFSARSKQRLMEGLAVSIQGHEIGFPDGPIKDELLRFEYVITRTGVTYASADGWPDDCVCALALAREQLTSVAPGASLMQFYGLEAAKARKQVIEELTLDEKPLVFGFSKPLPSDILTNELTDLYNETLKQYEPEARLCRRCGKEVKGSTRISDGVYIWHPECAG